MTGSAIYNLSILIVTWKGDKLLKNCLDSIQQIYDLAPEIIVVDNANLSSTKELVSTYPNTKYLASEQNLGFAGGNNLGLPHCSRDYILLLNNDTLIHNDAFSPLVDYLSAHDKVAVVQGKMRMPLAENTLDACGYMIDRCGGVYGRYNFRPSESTHTPTSPVYAAKGAFLMFKKSVLAEIMGPLFHDFFLNNGEETDFCYRVWLSGHEVHFVDGPAIDHLCGQSISRINATENGVRTLANLAFSYLTTFDAYGLMKVLPGFIVMRGIIAMIQLCKFNWHDAFSIFSILKLTLQRAPLIRSFRNEIQRARKVSDREIFAKVFVHPSTYQYYLGLRGKLVDYIRKNAATLPEVF